MVTVAALAAGEMSADALWRDQIDVENTVSTGFGELSVTLDEGSTTLDTATADDLVLIGFGFSEADADSMAESYTNGTDVVVTQTVVLSAAGLRGNQGMTYSAAALTPTPPAESWAGGSQITVWKSPDGQCDLTQAIGNNLQLSGTLVNPSYQNTTGSGKAGSVTLCLHAVYQGPKTYQNTGVLNLDEDPTTTAQSVWDAVIIPDADVDTDYFIPITVSTTHASGGDT
jgi:hypothetical protein